MTTLPTWARDALIVLFALVAFRLVFRLFRSLMRFVFLAVIAAVVVLVFLPHSALSGWLHHTAIPVVAHDPVGHASSMVHTVSRSVHAVQQTGIFHGLGTAISHWVSRVTHAR